MLSNYNINYAYYAPNCTNTPTNIVNSIPRYCSVQKFAKSLYSNILKGISKYYFAPEGRNLYKTSIQYSIPN